MCRAVSVADVRAAAQSLLIDGFFALLAQGLDTGDDGTEVQQNSIHLVLRSITVP